jgi:plasmid stabilization system protein ParE
MTFQVRYTKQARADLHRLFAYLAERDPALARKARDTIAKGMNLLKDFPFTCRKASPDTPFLREIVIHFGSSGYVALFEIENSSTVTVLAVRHQREDDYL